MKDTKNLHSVAINSVDNAMLITRQVTNALSPPVLGFADQRMISEPLKAAVDIILIGIRSFRAELCFAIFADFNQIEVSGPTQDDPSHAGRDARR